MYCKLVFDVPLDRDFDYAIPPELAPQVHPGIRVTAPFGRMLTTGLVTSVSQETTLQKNIVIKEIASVLDDKPLFGSDLFPLADFIKKTWGGPIGQILFSLIPPQAYFKRLESVTPPPFIPTVASPTLSQDDSAALHVLSGKLFTGFQRVLLTGTQTERSREIILQLAEQVLQNYGQVLLTLPDVWAAQQETLRLQKRFGAQWVLGWHSKMLLSQKKQIFSHISNGLPVVVVSARSGGLLPFKNLRLAAMLEEENENYKQEENKPYFHLREVLDFRCRCHEALFITSSDTPSLESIFTLSRAKASSFSLTEAKTGAAPIQITAKKGTRSALLSDELITVLQDRLTKQQPSLLLLNRRGYSNAYYCLNCGAYAKCEKCGSILAREKIGDTDQLICKKCGHKESLEQTCPQCKNKIFKSRGGGTQKIVTELQKLYPTARILRLDSDTLKNKDGQGHQVHRALQQGQVDIVVGTRQALSCIQDPRITFAAVLDADLELDTPDFRASENFAQLLFKLKNYLSTRKNGLLIIQTSSADIFPFQTLHHDYNIYAQEELLARESFAYPPFVQLIKVLIKSKDMTLLQSETSRLMTAGAPISLEVLGPVKTGKKTDVLKKQYVLYKVSAEQYPQLIHLLDSWQATKKVDIKVTADPYDFY
ncbi:MAG: primosomal protein N' [Elusimicrobiaceae bacterium]|nr:primosomal protein N' [Elusimicrobiaceae bacterium]